MVAQLSGGELLAAVVKQEVGQASCLSGRASNPRKLEAYATQTDPSFV